MEQALLSQPDRLDVSIAVEDCKGIVVQQYKRAGIGERGFRADIKLIFELDYVSFRVIPGHNPILFSSVRVMPQRTAPLLPSDRSPRCERAGRCLCSRDTSGAH
jgi:hypothetical protein